VETPDTQAIELLINELKELKRRAGMPSLGELVTLSKKKISKSTLNDVLSGRRIKPPQWRFVSAYVVACQAAAQSTGIDPKRLGTLDEWFVFWDATSKGNREAISPLQQSVRPTEPINELEVEARPGWLSTSGAPEPASGNTEASTAPLMQRLEEDVSRLQASLSIYEGRLVVTNGPKFGAIYKIQSHITMIGRNAECDIWLNEAAVSRRHAEIRCYGDKFTIRDLGSLNGTFREDRRIIESLLMCYDELTIGRFRLMFVQGGNYVQRLCQQRYYSARASLIRDSSADTADIALFLLIREATDYGPEFVVGKIFTYLSSYSP
jgi:hypothetical protein